MYSLSTCWNSNRHTDGRAMLRELRDSTPAAYGVLWAGAVGAVGYFGPFPAWK